MRPTLTTVGETAADFCAPHARDASAPHDDIEQLYRRERANLQRFVARGQPEDRAQDFVQRVFVRLLSRKPADTTPLTSPASYLRQAARNLVRDDARAACRQARLSVDPAAAVHDPVAMLEARDGLARIHAAVMRLKPLTREIFLARRLDGYSYADIAARTGLSIKGVEKQMSRAVRQLGRHLNPDV